MLALVLHKREHESEDTLILRKLLKGISSCVTRLEYENVIIVYVIPHWNNIIWTQSK